MTDAELIILVGLAIFAGLYAIVILLFTFGWSRLGKTVQKKAEPEFVSIIVPFRNESYILNQLSESLIAQEYPKEHFEIILVNDHSTDQSVQFAESYCREENYKLLHLPEGKNGKKYALEYGISHARGKYILCTDADCRPGKDWLKSMLNALHTGNHKMLSGPVAIENTQDALTGFQALEFLSLVGSGAGAIGAGRPIMCNGANLMYEKEAFGQVNGFEGNKHIRGGDDIFLLEKFRKTFGPNSIGFARDRRAIVYTTAVSGLGAFINQRFRWVAKSPAYRDAFMIFTALVVMLFNLGIVISLIWGFISLNAFLLFAAAYVFKCLVDLPLLWKVTGFAGQRRLLRNYVSYQLIYPFFIVFSGIMGNILSYRWKQ